MSGEETEKTASEFISDAKDESLTDLFLRGFGGWILALWTSLIGGFQDVFDLLFLPFELFIDIASESVNSFILEPMGIVEEGARVTGEEIVLFDVFALPFAVAIALGTLLIVIFYLQLSSTSNILPGIVVDNRLMDFFFTTAEEEAQGED